MTARHYVNTVYRQDLLKKVVRRVLNMRVTLHLSTFPVATAENMERLLFDADAYDKLNAVRAVTPKVLRRTQHVCLVLPAAPGENAMHVGVFVYCDRPIMQVADGTTFNDCKDWHGGNDVMRANDGRFAWTIPSCADPSLREQVLAWGYEMTRLLRRAHFGAMCFDEIVKRSASTTNIVATWPGAAHMMRFVAERDGAEKDLAREFTYAPVRTLGSYRIRNLPGLPGTCTPDTVAGALDLLLAEVLPLPLGDFDASGFYHANNPDTRPVRPLRPHLQSIIGDPDA